MAYDISDALLVLRTINTIIQQNPKLMEEEGIFRVTGNSKHVDELIDTIIDPIAYSSKIETILSNQELSIHDLIGAAKKVIKNLPPLDNQTTSLMDQAADKDDSLDRVFYHLVNSGDLNQMYYAEILYIYAQMMDASRPYAKTTKMDTPNLAMMLGQALNGGSEDISSIMKFKAFSARVIDSETYHHPVPFTTYIGIKHPELLPKMKEARQNVLDIRTKGLKNIGGYINNIKTNLKKSETLKVELEKSLEQIENQIQEKANKKDLKTVYELQKQKKILQEKLELLGLKIKQMEITGNRTVLMQKHDMGAVKSLNASLKNIDVITKESEKFKEHGSEKVANFFTDKNDDVSLNEEARLNPKKEFEVKLSERPPEMPPLVEIEDDEFQKIVIQESKKSDEISSGPPPEPDISQLDPVEDKETIQILQNLHKLYVSQWESEQKSKQQANILREALPIMPDLNLLLSNSDSISKQPTKDQPLTESQEIKEILGIIRKEREQKPKASIVLKGLDNNPLYLTPKEFAKKMQEVDENWDMTDDFNLTQSDVERLESAPQFVTEPQTSPKTTATVRDKSMFSVKPEIQQRSNTDLNDEYDSDDEPEKRP